MTISDVLAADIMQRVEEAAPLRDRAVAADGMNGWIDYNDAGCAHCNNTGWMSPGVRCHDRCPTAEELS